MTTPTKTNKVAEFIEETAFALSLVKPLAGHTSAESIGDRLREKIGSLKRDVLIELAYLAVLEPITDRVCELKREAREQAKAREQAEALANPGQARARTKLKEQQSQAEWDRQYGDGAWQRIQDQIARRDKEIEENKIKYMENRRKEEEARQARIDLCNEKMKQAVEDFRTEVIQEWTDELLSQRFRTTDGRFVSWGEATAEEHEACQDLLTSNATKSAMEAAKHATAAELIRRKGATTLAEAVAA